MRVNLQGKPSPRFTPQYVNAYYLVIKMVSISIFFEDELLAWIEGGKKKTVDEINEEAKAFISEKHSDSSLL